MIVDLYSKRRKRECGEFSDVYQYENIPDTFRVQIFQIFQEAFEHESRSVSTTIRQLIEKINLILRKEYGVFNLHERDRGLYEFGNFFLKTRDHEKALDVIELVFRFIDLDVRKNQHDFYGRFSVKNLNIDQLIEELNHRFKEAGLGYQYESGELIRVDSQFIHSEAVKPVLKLLNELKYKSVNEEFLSAHEHYRHGRFEESIIDCLKSFESLIKTICTNQGWAYTSKDNASKLIQIILDNELIPSYLNSQINGMKNLLDSGIPTIRNKIAAHGQGPSSRTVPDYMASYTLHLTATTLLLLANAEKAKG